MVWKILFKNFPQFVVVRTVKGFSMVDEIEVDVFLEFPCFFYDPADVRNLISWFLCLFLNQLEYLEVHGSRTIEA